MADMIKSVKDLSLFVKKVGYSKLCFVVSNKILSQAESLIPLLTAPNALVIITGDGEQLKEWSFIEKILAEFVEKGLDRKSLVVAVGGGTVGDSVGFACSIYLRGVRYINIPTTLVAQADSSHGGKTAVNFKGYKNMIGTFHPAIATVIETKFLETLGPEQIIDGLGEIIKAGFIKDPSILKLLESETVGSLATSSNLESIIQKAIAVKLHYVKKDPFDKGVRQILNVGHTVGHAIELSNNLSHGRAVLVGMSKEFEICERLGLTHFSVRQKLNDLINKLGIKLLTDIEIDYKAVMKDKKIEANTLTLPIITKIGKSSLVKVHQSDIIPSIH